MKRCEDYTAALSAFADGELNETERSDTFCRIWSSVRPAASACLSS